MAIGQPALIEVLDKMQMPYTISTPTSALACLAFSPRARQETDRLIKQTLTNRSTLIRALAHPKLTALGVGKTLGGNHANFVVAQILASGSTNGASADNTRAKIVAERLRVEHGISVRFIGNLTSCTGCLRVTIGTELENTKFVAGLSAALNAC